MRSEFDANIALADRVIVAHAYASLSFRATVELLRRLGGGRVGFDYMKHSLADLRRFVASWIDAGDYTLQHVEAIAIACAK